MIIQFAGNGNREFIKDELSHDGNLTGISFFLRSKDELEKNLF